MGNPENDLLLDPEYYTKYFNRFKNDKEVKELNAVKSEFKPASFRLAPEALDALEELIMKD